MSRLRRDPRVRLACAALAMALLPACSLPGFLRVAKPEDGVTVKQLTADLAFGAEEQAVAATEAATLLPDALTDVALGPFAPLVEMFDLEPEYDYSFPPPPPLPPLGPSNSECPEASDTAFPEKPASALVEGTAKPGIYKWKQSGTFELIGLIKIPLPPLTTRTVRPVETLTPNAFAFEIEQLAFTNREIDTYEVRYSSAGAPTDGLYLTRLQYISPTARIDFNPVPGAEPKLFSLPVKPIEPISGSAVDVEDRLSLQITGTANGTERIRLDACGEIVEAWKFAGNRVLQGLTPKPSTNPLEPGQTDQIANTTYDFYFAPQLGGLVVGDHIVTDGNFGPFRYRSDITSNIGTLSPKPLPQ